MTSIEVPGKPLTINFIAAKTHWVAAEEVKTWRAVAKLMAKAQKIGSLQTPLCIEVRHLCKGRLPDIAASTFAVKGCVDGFVDAGLLPDDSPKYLHGMYLPAPEKSDRDALVFEFEPVETFWHDPSA